MPSGGFGARFLTSGNGSHAWLYISVDGIRDGQKIRHFNNVLPVSIATLVDRTSPHIWIVVQGEATHRGLAVAGYRSQTDGTINKGKSNVFKSYHRTLTSPLRLADRTICLAGDPEQVQL